MTDWNAAVSSGDATALVDLVLASTASPAQALELFRRCVSLCEAKLNGGPKTDGTAETDGSSTTGESIKSDPGAWTREALCTLQGVQLLHPRGRFDMEFRSVGVSISGKAGAATLAWENVRHHLRIPRPEGYAWGKMDSADPAGSDLLAAPLKGPVPYRKATLSLVVIQPDPKAKQPEVSLTVEGVPHKVAGSQGTVIMELLKLFMPTTRLTLPDRLSFLSRDSKSFVKCYHGVHEGSLFPLNQGLLFMKPGLFLPLEDIEEVVCGRGGSAQTRYVDLVVTMQASSSGAGDEEKGTREEFSNINRDDLSSLQHYIQTALVAPRQREAKRAEKARKAEESRPAVAPSVTVNETERGNDRSGENQQSSQENGDHSGGGSASSARSGSQYQAHGDGGEENHDRSRAKATSRSCALVARNAISQRQGVDGEDDEDEEDEEDETFEPLESEGNSSGDDSRVEGYGDDDASDNGEEEDQEEPYDEESDGDGGDQSDPSPEGACQSGSGPKRPRADDDDGDGDRPSHGTTAAGVEEDGGAEAINDDGDKTDSDDGARSRPAKRAR